MFLQTKKRSLGGHIVLQRVFVTSVYEACKGEIWCEEPQAKEQRKT